MEAVGTAYLQVDGATGLDLLSGTELHVLPDFRIHRKEGGLGQIVAHALQEFVR